MGVFGSIAGPAVAQSGLILPLPQKYSRRDECKLVCYVSDKPEVCVFSQQFRQNTKGLTLCWHTISLKTPWLRLQSAKSITGHALDAAWFVNTSNPTQEVNLLGRSSRVREHQKTRGELFIQTRVDVPVTAGLNAGRERLQDKTINGIVAFAFTHQFDDPRRRPISRTAN